LFVYGYGLREETMKAGGDKNTGLFIFRLSLAIFHLSLPEARGDQQ